jgi:hypothetical protein
MAEMDGQDDVPKIKLGDASCAAPFSSKLSHVAASQQRLVFSRYPYIDINYSHAYHQAGSLHPCRHNTDVQDSRSQLFDHSVQFECTIP